MKNAKWVSDKNAVPAIYHELRVGRRTVAIVRRVGGKKTKRGWSYRYQVVTRFVDIMGGAIGPIFPSLPKAKAFVEGRL